MGNKNSGRRPMRDLDIRRAVIDKAWKVTQQALDGYISLANKDRSTIAAGIAQKDMTQRTENDTRVHISQEESDILSKYIQGNRIGSTT